MEAKDFHAINDFFCPVHPQWLIVHCVFKQRTAFRFLRFLGSGCHRPKIRGKDFFANLFFLAGLACVMALVRAMIEMSSTEGFEMSFHRAAKGGQVGVNGEFYEGGKFLPSTDRPKGKPIPRKVGKVQVEPFVWVIPPEGKRPLLRHIGIYLVAVDRWDASKGVKPYEPYLNSGRCDKSWDEVRALAARWNAGERWE